MILEALIRLNLLVVLDEVGRVAQHDQRQDEETEGAKLKKNSSSFLFRSDPTQWFDLALLSKDTGSIIFRKCSVIREH